MTRLLRYRRDGLTFDVRDEGPLDGDPVVLLHGFPERNTCWREVAPLLHAQGLRTYAPDQRGYSPGARPPRRRDYTMDKLEADVVALIETVGRPVHLVGHDWGANTGWLAAAHRPDLVRTLDRRLRPSPGGVPQRHVHQPAGVQVVVHVRLPDPGPPGTAGRRARAAGSTASFARAG